MTSILMSVLSFLFAIGVLVAVHEWGHYIVARLVGVKVLCFSIGFGRSLWSRISGPDQTEYRIAAIPLGGYVKLLDEREGSVPAGDQHRAFNRQSVSSRVAILSAGPVMNFVFAIVAFWCMYLIGVPGLKPVVGAVAPDTPAATAGLQRDDLIVAVAGRPVATWEGAVLALLDGVLDAERIAVEVDRPGAGTQLVYLSTGRRVSELTEPGALLPGLGMQPWAPQLEPVLGEIMADGSAAEAGMQSGDRIMAVGDLPLNSWGDWVEFVRASPGELASVTIERDGQLRQLPILIGTVLNEAGEEVGRIGAAVRLPEDPYAEYRARQQYGAMAALEQAVTRTWSMSVLTVRMVVRMVTGDVSVKNISGPINIAQYAGYSASVGISSFLSFLAVVSLSLGILNLLPIPVLDGGQIVYQLLEAVKGAPLSERMQLVGQQIGIAFLVLIMSFAFYNDLTRVFS
ncbi:MAG: RIP metalloprotease RseP [Gammaproteobacteria bacterium]|nr:RIP metalloprotease RseP [Gammaproteobacteria bacterium]